MLRDDEPKSMKSKQFPREGDTEMTFEWDEGKDQQNRHKHGVGFDEAKTVFGDPLAITIADPEHAEEEDRFLDLGISAQGRLLVVSYTERGSNIRIISCRKANKSERRIYEQTNEIGDNQ